MPRNARFVIPHVALHIVQRGHDRRECFRDEIDRVVYLSALKELSTETRCAVHAYCLMTNHVHLLVTPPTADASARLMRNLGQRYVQYFNRRYYRRGTLWEGRFRSCIVESSSYVVACYRYIELNPVRAGMASSPSAYRWSSHAQNAGYELPSLVSPHAEYLALGAENQARYLSYRGLFDSEDDSNFLAAIRDATNGGFALVGETLRSGLTTEQQLRLQRSRPQQACSALD
jgi:putative transposase